MPNQERERIGPFVITSRDNLSPLGILCACCEKQMTVLHRDLDRHVPACEELIEAGAVAWPNFGWFCSPACEDAYARQYNVRGERIAQSTPRPRQWWRRLFDA